MDYFMSTTAVLFFECDIEAYGGSYSSCFVHRRPTDKPFCCPQQRRIVSHKEEVLKELAKVAGGTFHDDSWNRIINDMENADFPSIEGCAFFSIFLHGNKEYVSTKNLPFLEEILSSRDSFADFISVEDFCRLHSLWNLSL